ncbi:glycosyltransferase [Paracoccus zeaxanthinifaciens]|uniref:capsular polysaccharide export protein, LipB/KpsS family n=1 Tax=Paracoccus zeaxanthinifaciens TaxID=187400 RepID=UPI0003B639F0|nr:glycosyltransferase [Paracoccus zeaxanthinifaciens]
MTKREDQHGQTHPSDLYARFLELIGRNNAPDVSDFREALLAQRHQLHRIGFPRRNLMTGFSANLPRLFPNLIAMDETDIDGNAPVMMYGAILDDLSKSHDSTRNLLPRVRRQDRVLFFEMGFLASTTSWSEALASRDPRQACLGYIFDDRAQYYMSDYETRLDEKLNGDFSLTVEQRARAERAMQRIVDARISKYNSQPFYRPSVSPDYAHRVLVVDQNFSDASTFYGRASEQDFKAMLDAAVSENPDAEILVKTHPDLNWVKGATRRGYFDHLTSEGRVRILRDSVNPFELFDMVDKVYVGTSGMGLEALLAGKPVVCFGAPLYAGWGLTDDRTTVPHRHRSRDLAELFYAIYIWYTIYHLPEGDMPAEIEDVLDFIETNRPVRPSPQEVQDIPDVSIVIPVYGVERYVAECLGSIQRQSMQNFEVILIDDVSPDRSADIVESFVAHDPRFRLVRRTENVGPGFARNQGMDLASGRFVLFIDPDDYMPDPGHLKRVVDMADADEADMVRYRKRYEQIEDEQGNVLKMRRDTTEGFFPREVHRTSLDKHHEIAHSRHFWNWLYRRDFLDRNQIRFLTSYREERAFLLQAYMADPVISLCNSNGVVYRIRSDSAVRRAQTMADVDNQLQNFDLVVRHLRDHGALDPGSPHWWLARFQVSQFLHYLYFGFAWKTAKAEKSEDVFIERLAATLERSGLGHQHLLRDPSQLSAVHLRAGAYGLLFAATRLRRRDYIERAHAIKPIDAAELYKEYLQNPKNAAERDFQQALNTYARNKLVKPSTSPNAMPCKLPRVILHLGATKTGSTVLQHLLEDNRPELLRNGIWYPEVGLFWQADRPHKQAGHVGFISEASDKRQILRQHLLSGLSLMDGRIHTIVLSSEAFFLNRNSLNLAEYFKNFNPEMVVYLRRQDEWANSQYCEFVAGGAINSTSESFARWVAKDKTQELLDYDGLVRGWEQHLPPKAIHVRRYLRTRSQEWSIIDDFASVTRLPLIARLPLPDRHKTNEARVSATHVELIRQFNKRPFSNKQIYLKFIEAITTGLVAWRRQNKLPMPAPWVLSDKEATSLMEAAAAGNGRIARDYFDSEAIDLFPRREAPPPSCPIYLEEFQLAEAAYAESTTAAKKAKAKKKLKRIVNYGPFGWRLWSSVPMMALVYRRRGRNDLASSLTENPAAFAREHWEGRHSRLCWLAYSKASPLGPQNMLRVWLPILEPVVRRRGGDTAVKHLHSTPIVFVRNIRNPFAKLVGRLMFPMGEKS